MNIVEVTRDNVSEKGFFCYMSKKKSEGYQRKLRWLRDRFNEGMRINLLDLQRGGRGFIEYVPGQYAWRAVNADGYMFIHCIWVAGKSKGKGYATQLLGRCLKDAEKEGMKGVAVVTSEGNWLVGRKFFLRHGFESIDQCPPFGLMVRRFNSASPPSFSGDFEKRLKTFGEDLIITRTDQCPYVDAGVMAALEAAKELGIPAEVVELRNSQEVRELSPSPYGVFGIVYDGKLVSYHSAGKKELMTCLGSLKKEK